MKQLIIYFLAMLSLSSIAVANQELRAARVDQLPVIDGIADDAVWQQAIAIRTIDLVANIEIELKAVYTVDGIAILVQYPDTTETRVHKPLNWDTSTRLYKVGSQREDAMIFKWNMDPFATDLTLQSNKPYKADIWYWKSYRSDHAGYADDKFQIYSRFEVGRKNKTLLSKDGSVFHFSRHGDDGKSAYKSMSPTEYSGDTLIGYSLRTPVGSRADVRAKGVWRNNRWTIEFSRKLNTGNADDVKFIPGQSFLFGVSRYEIASRKPDPKINPPNYGSGEVSEALTLMFAP